MISAIHKRSFDSLRAAFSHGDVALMECEHASTGAPIITLCIMAQVDGEWVTIPVAAMLEINPFKTLIPPPGELHESVYRPTN